MLVDFNIFLLLDVPSFQSPLVGPCLHTHTEFKKGLILKPERGPSPKSQARTRFEPDSYFWSPIEAWKLRLPRELDMPNCRVTKNIVCRCS